MNINSFHEGQQLKAIFWPESGESATVGENSVLSIEVVMEYGQMAPVPWVLVKRSDGRSHKFNLALAEGVELIESNK